MEYYLDDKRIHTDNHNVPREGGSLQLKLWADGNRWWSGIPSRTDVRMRVKSIIAYYNTTSSLTNQEWHNRCAREKKQCKAVTSTKLEKNHIKACPYPGKVCSPQSHDHGTSTAAIAAAKSTAKIIILPNLPVHVSSGHQNLLKAAPHDCKNFIKLAGLIGTCLAAVVSAMDSM